MTELSSLVFQHTSQQSEARVKTLQPMPLWQSFIFFGVSTMAMILSYYLFRPFLVAAGESPFEAFLASTLLPMALMFTAALVAYYRVEGHPLTRQAFSERMRYPRLNLKAAILGIGIGILASLAIGLLNVPSQALLDRGLIPLPQDAPGLHQLIGPELRGNWDIVLLFLINFLFNIVGEELWWRGYILPRQELAHGRATWFIHGLLWTGFYAFKYWEFLSLLPVTLLLTYISQRTKNNWPALIAHAIVNGLGFVLVLTAVVG